MTMDSKTLEALKGSIEKWKGILVGEIEDEGISNCPLCRLHHKNRCRGCPVSEKTGKDNCTGTPYDIWVFHQFRREDWGNQQAWKATDKRSKVLAQREIDFLEDLLPKEGA